MSAPVPPPAPPDPAPPPRRASRFRPERATVVTVLVATAAGLLLFALYARFVLQSPASTLTLSRGETTYELLSPRMLAALLLAPWFILVLGRSLADLPWPQRVLSLAMRLAFVAALALGLARLARTATSEEVSTVYLVDVSDSAPDEALADAQAALDRAARERAADDELKVVTFARRPRQVAPPAEGGAPRIARHLDERGERGELGAGSNAQAALQLAYGLFPPGRLKRVVLLSDGVETDGDLLAEVNRARELGVRLFTIPYRRPAPAEVAVRELRLPSQVKVGETFEVKAELYASRASRAKIRLYQGEALNGLDSVRELDLAPGTSEVAFRSVVRVAGEVTYGLELEPLGEDRFRENNRVSSTVDVPGRPAVLYVEGQPARASYLAGALAAQQLDVDVRTAGAFPGALKELERYDLVIVSDVPREALSLSAQDLLEQYVRDLGGGFVFAGGEAGYGLGGWQHSTVERLLPVRMDSERRKEMPSVAMALVIDRSGSMNGLPLEMAKAAAKATVGVLAADDLLEVIAFDSQPTRFVKMQPARNRSRIAQDISRIAPGGGTEIFPALDAAYQDMTVTQARKKHVILLTDGRAPNAGIRDLVSAMIAESITVTSVGLGPEVDEPLLRMIADVGGGRYHGVHDPSALPRIFTKETEQVARSAAVEEWFPVTQVGDAAFLRGVDVRSAPFLHGYVATQLKPPPAQELLQSDRGEPILARWRVGLGWTLAWTSDVKNLWAVEWLRWPGFGRFWGQLVREHMRQKHRRELDMKTEVVAGELVATVDAFSIDDRFDNGLRSRLAVIGPEPKGETRWVAMRQVAPGRYEARVPLERYGSFLLRAEHAREGEDGRLVPVASSHGHVGNPYPREYASFEADEGKLVRAAKATGGLVDPSPAQVADPAGEKVVYRQDLWPRFVGAAIALLVLDLLLRRVRLFDRKFVAATRRRARQAA